MSLKKAVLTEGQLQALEQGRRTKEAHVEIESEHPGYLGSQDTYYVSHRDWANLSTDSCGYLLSCCYGKTVHGKTAITATDMLNNTVLPFYESQGVPLLRILTDRGSEYCGQSERHVYPLCLAIKDMTIVKTKAYSPQTNGICERFHKTVEWVLRCRFP